MYGCGDDGFDGLVVTVVFFFYRAKALSILSVEEMLDDMGVGFGEWCVDLGNLCDCVLLLLCERSFPSSTKNGSAI